MFLSKVKLNKGLELYKFLKKKRGSDGYAIHQLLWDLFPNDGSKKRDFLFHKEEKSREPCFYVLSKEKPVSNSSFAIQTKSLHPSLNEGQKLAFTLNANPVKSRKIEGKKNSIKHDVWMDAKYWGKHQNLSENEIYSACIKASKDWLVDQGNRCGFSIDHNKILIDGYLQNYFYKGSSKRPIRFSSIHYEGILTVTNPSDFIRMLGEGLGRSKAFGCGLMLIRRV